LKSKNRSEWIGIPHNHDETSRAELARSLLRLDARPKISDAHGQDNLALALNVAAPQILAELTRIRFEMTAIRKLLYTREARKTK
jgi:hypothetical protein